MFYKSNNPNRKLYSVTLIGLRVPIPITYKVTASNKYAAIAAAVKAAVRDAGPSATEAEFHVERVTEQESTE
ncbi:MAG: hypothetical protein LC108_15590 [Anaerolineales bacterium]|nr:hypothetical protein [Anaerolineales bacterium]